VRNRMDTPGDPAIVAELTRTFTDFVRAYDEKGMSPVDFDGFGATRRTLRQYSKATDDLVLLIRDFMIPNPDA